MFLVVVLSLIAFCSAGCPLLSVTTTCVASKILSSDGTCQCWSDLKNQNGYSDCTAEDALAHFALIKTGCKQLYFDFVPSTCIQSSAVQIYCGANILNTGKTLCDCYNDYKTNSDKLCTNNDGLDALLACKAGLLGQSCGSADACCSILENVIDNNVTASFSSCWNTAEKCNCYDSKVAVTTSGWDVCGNAQKFQLQACVQTQLSCDAFDGSANCKTVDVTLSIDQIKQLWTDFKDKIVLYLDKTLSALPNLSISVTKGDQTTEGNSVTFTIDFQCSATATKEELIAAFNKQVAAAVGMKESQFTTTITFTNSAKRQSSQTGTATLLGQGESDGNSASSLAVLFVPLLAFLSTFYYLF